MNDIAVIDHGALPEIQNARLPATYEAAVIAIRECARLDECKNWADRAAAMASYAKQAQDETLMNMARRIQARAYERCGELLKQIEPAPGARTDLEPSDGDDSRLTRKQAARDAGLSEREQVTALRIASIPEGEREELIEGDDPPTVTELAARGTKRKPSPDPEEYLKGRDPEDFAQATQLLGLFDHFVRDRERFDLGCAARGLDAKERHRVRDAIADIRGWLDMAQEAVDGL